MNRKASLLTLLISLFVSAGSLVAQQQSDAGYKSITEDELRTHIYFLASDYMNGRVATSPEYAIAAQYVASQFAKAGLKPMVIKAGSEPSYFQGLPFAHTKYNDQFLWTVTRKGAETKLVHKTDYKILTGSPLNFDKLQLVYVGYGIEEPTENWTDLKDLDLKGKVAVCLTGAPMKDGQPVLSKAINDKYTGKRGNFFKSFGGMNAKGVAGIIMVDPNGTSDQSFDQVNSSLSTEKTTYMGGERNNPMGARTSVYMVKPEFLDLVMPGMKNNPKGQADVLKKYKPAELDNTYLTSKIEILKEDTLYSNNVIGIVPGTDETLRDEYIIVGGHLDHIAPQKGMVCNGADDNASGASGVMEIAEAVAKNPCKRTMVFVTWSGEEMGLLGSAFFLKSGIIPKEKIKFNINMDMIGRTGKGNEATRAHYVVSDEKHIKGITAFIEEINKGVTEFPIIFNDDKHSPGGSDHMTFNQVGIPAFFFFSGVHPDLHNPGDDPEKIDYPKAASICRLGYLIAEKLGNMAVVPNFE